MIMADELKACPFCGSTNIDAAGWASTETSGPACDDCGGSAGSAHLSREENIAAWNTRPLTGGVTEEMRPLETAPKDGTYFLMVGGNFDGGAAVVQWNGDWWTLDDGKNPEIALRHESGLIGWLPLPEAIALAVSNASRGNENG